MGCDIHVRTEFLYKGKWWSADFSMRNPITGKSTVVPIYKGQCYMTFAILADVRNSFDVLPIGLPKGMPSEMSSEVRSDIFYWGPDAHDISYYTLQELESNSASYRSFCHEGYVTEKAYEAYSLNGYIPTDYRSVPEGEYTVLCPACTSDTYKDFHKLVSDVNTRYNEILLHLNLIYEKDIYTKDCFRIVFWFDS